MWVQKFPLLPQRILSFSPDKVALYKKRYEEGYDLEDPGYVAWLKINHPTEVCSIATKSSSDSGKLLLKEKDSSDSGKPKPSSSDAVSEILVFPSPVSRPKSKRKPALNARTVCITDDSVLEELKKKEVEKAEIEKEKEAKRLEKERKKKVKEEKQLLKEQKKKERTEKQLPTTGGHCLGNGKKTRSKRNTCTQQRASTPIDEVLAAMQLSSDIDDEAECDSDSSKDDATCPKCGATYTDSTEKWICCDGCNMWFNKKCMNIKGRVPKFYYCESCVS